MSIDGEPHSPCFLARDSAVKNNVNCKNTKITVVVQFSLPSVLYRDDSGLVLCDLLEYRLGEIEVVLGWVAPPSCIIWECVVGWTEIRGSDTNGSRDAPLPIINTLDLVTRTASCSFIEQSSA